MLFRGDSAREQIDRLRFVRARRSICALGEITVTDYVASWHHVTKAKALEEAIKYARFKGKKGGIARLLISEPPQHGKSLHAGELAPALALGQDPDMTVMVTAYGSGLATERVEKTRAIMQTDAYKAAFPTRVGSVVDSVSRRTVSAKDQASYFRTMRAHSDGTVTHARGHYYAAGLTAGFVGYGYRLGIMDDWIKGPADAASPTAALKRIQTYTQSFETRQQGVAAIVGIAQMWDNPDWLDWLFDLWTDQGHDPVWLRFPALSDDTAIYPLHPDDPRSEGSDESLWPSRFPHEEQRKKRDGLIARDKNAWMALQQQNPLRISGQLFPKGAWLRFDVDGPNAFDLRQLDAIHFSVDGNIKESGTSFAVIGVYGTMDRRGPDGQLVRHYFRLDESRGHYGFSTLRDEMIRIWNKWKTAFRNKVYSGKVWVEDKANGPALMSILAGRGIPFHAVPKSRSKLTCYRMAQLVQLDARCWIPRGTSALIQDSWVNGPDGFINELANQPAEAGKPDDRADEFSQMIICNDPTLGVELLRVG